MKKLFQPNIGKTGRILRGLRAYLKIPKGAVFGQRVDGEARRRGIPLV
jgi:hypothetical protein